MMKHLKLGHNDEVLDISAGTGLLAEEIAIQFGPLKRIVLNDPSKNMLAEAKYRLRYVKNVEFTSFFAEELSFEENSFSNIVCLNSFHYYTNQPGVVEQLMRMLKPGGTLYLLDWNRKGFFIFVSAAIKLWSKEHIHSRSFEELKKLLTEHGFMLRKHKEWRYWWWNFCFLKCSKPKK
jgi:ubiquinone/menaquinone biosynthesis C-methylase UbiE